MNLALVMQACIFNAWVFDLLLEQGLAILKLATMTTTAKHYTINVI